MVRRSIIGGGCIGTRETCYDPLSETRGRRLNERLVISVGWQTDWQHTYPRRAFGLLRSRTERPSHPRTAEKRDELASPRLSRPGRNVTGFSDVLADLSGKYVELARELGGQQATVDYLWHTEWPDGQRRHDATEQAAQSLGAQIRSWRIKDVAGLDDAVAAIKKSGASTFIIQPSPFTYTQRARVIDAANKYRLGTIYGFPIAARDGALVAYGPDYVDMYRQAGTYVARILKGEKPANLAVVEPTKFVMVINRKTAEALALIVPNTMLVAADEVIE